MNANRSFKILATTAYLTCAGFISLYGCRAASGAGSGEGGFLAWDGSVGAPSYFVHALGPTHIVTLRNGDIRYFTRDGTMTFEHPLGDFIPYGLAEAAVMFDPHARRFLAAGRSGGSVPGCHVSLAVSDDEDPHGDWLSTHINCAQVFGPDYSGYPRAIQLGIDDQAIYLTFDSHSSFPEDRKSWIIIFDRAALLDGEDAIANAFQTHTFNVSYAPARIRDMADAQYLVTTYGQPIGTTRLTFRAIRDPLGTPDLDTFILDVPPFDYGPFAIPALDVPFGINSYGADVKRVVYHNGSLWLAHHGRPAGQDRVTVIWYEIALNGWPVSSRTPTIHQTGVIDPDPEVDVHTWIPDLAVDINGTVVFSYARSAADEFQAAGRSFRRAGDPPGTVQGHAVIRQSELGGITGGPAPHAYVSSAAEDPDRPGVFFVGGTYWRENMYGGISRSMWIAPVSTPLPGDVDGDGDVDFTDLLALLAAWGPCPPPPSACPADFDGTGSVDFTDLLTLLAHWS